MHSSFPYPENPTALKKNWNFTLYPPEQVVALYALTQKPCEAIEEAFEEKMVHGLLHLP